MKRILLVDDDKDMLELYQIVLESDEFDVITAQDGATGIERAKKEQPDLILLDVMMPNMSGVQALQKLKADPDTKAIPVIMFSNFSDEDYVHDALNAGAIKYIVKTDYEPDDLVKELNQILQDHEARIKK